MTDRSTQIPMGEVDAARRWQKLPRSFRDLTYRDLVKRLARTLDREETLQALELATAFCVIAAEWAAARPSTSLGSYRAAVLVAAPDSSSRVANLHNLEHLTDTDVAFSAQIAIRWLSSALARDVYPSKRLWSATVEALFIVLADKTMSDGVREPGSRAV